MMDESKEVRQIPIEDIIPNRFQPRINFDENALNELSESIKQHGIIQPLVLRPLGDKFEIIAGERRYKAATLAGLSTVPGIVTDMDDNTSAEVALIENVQRKDLSAIEEAKSYKSMLERSNMTQEELAKKMGLSQSTIANKLRLLNLADEVQNALAQEKISERHARALLSINNKQEQINWLNRIINERLTVRQLDLAIKDEQSQNESSEEDVPKVNINPDIESIMNNAVDINPTTSASNDNNEDDTDAGISRGPNKFFNYLEDQEVNMSMTEKNEEEPKNNPPADGFNFVPEFGNAPENKFKPEEEIETLDDLDITTSPASEQIIEEPIYKEENVATSAPTVENQPVETIDTIEENQNNVEELIEPSVEVKPEMIETSEPDEEISVSEAIDQATISPETQVVEQTVSVPTPQEENSPIDNAEEFIFDDDVDTTDETSESPKNSDIEIEPIPPFEGEGVVDPVSYYDTLDPNFLNKVKEYIGLDLKNAINSYRELTDTLNKQGFNISIDETDLDNKYYIEININKE